MLFHVYKEDVPEGYYLNEPEPGSLYRTLLDADWLMYCLLPLLLIIIVLGLMYAWRMHEIPKHKADHKKMRQAELVSALTLVGMFMHWVWVIALIIAYVDWDAVEEALTRILRNSRTITPEPSAEVLVVADLPPAPPPEKAPPPPAKPAEGSPA